MRLERYITEALHGINTKDSLLILEPLRSWLKKFKYADINQMKSLVKKVKKLKKHGDGDSIIYYIDKISSSTLKSPICKEAHKLLPIYIYIGFVDEYCVYEYNKYIHIGPNIKSIEEDVNKNNIDDALGEIDEYYIASSFIHELTHWLDDSFYGFRHPKKKGIKYNDPKVEKMKEWMDYSEINAFVHSIALAKLSFSDDEWNKMSFREMISVDSPIENVSLSLGKDFDKAIKRRLAREDLLGRNMR